MFSMQFPRTFVLLIESTNPKAKLSNLSLTLNYKVSKTPTQIFSVNHRAITHLYATAELGFIERSFIDIAIFNNGKSTSCFT